VNPLDLAIQNATKRESKLSADETTLGNLKTAAETAAAPIPGQQGIVDQDVIDFNTAMDELSAAALASKRPVPPPVPVVDPAPLPVASE